MQYSAIVVGTDGSKAATETVRQGAELARSSGAALHIVAAYRELKGRELDRARREFPVGLDVDRPGDTELAARAILEDAELDVGGDGLAIRLHAVKGDPASAIIEVAERERAELIVVGNRGVGNPLRRLRRPIYDRVERRAPCEVRVVDTEHFRRPSVAA
jgi:nucleotide-binding universal stress UspA family protein